MGRMGSSTLWGKIIALLAVCGWGLSAQAKYSGGSGEPNDPYQITSVADWQELMATPADWAGHFILTSDIDLNGVSITPIAPDTSTSYDFQGTQFTGVLDGNDHIVCNVDINMPGVDYVGLFGYVGTGGQIKNLGVENASIFGNKYVGGLVGFAYNDAITDCYCTGSVRGNSDVGGLVGVNYYGTISACYSAGSVSGVGDYAGGLVGRNYFGPITNSYSTGSVSGHDGVGGLVGENDSSGTITKCYSTGGVSGKYVVGGLVGWNKSTVTASFWDTQTSGQSGSAGGTPKTTAEMKTMSTFTDVGWDFVNVWHLCEGTNYPRLLWQIPAGDFLCPYGVDVLDLAFSVDRWLDGDCNESNDFCNCTDINHNAQVDFGDFAFFSTHWLESGEDDAGREPLPLLGRADIQMGEPNSFAVEFIMVGKQRLDRTVFEYQCEVILTNLSPTTFENAQLVMVSWPGNMTIMDPHLTFGDAQIGPGESATSIDTCTFTVDRSRPIKPLEVIWRYVPAPQDMAFIPRGTFQMGDSLGDGYSDELPVHTVTVDSFYMVKYEITNQQYCQYLNSALAQGLITVTSSVVYKAGSGTSYPYCDTSTSNSDSQIAYSGGVFSVRTKNGRNMSNDPMVMVSWYGAVAYCNWRSLQEGYHECHNLSTWDCDFNKKGYRLATEAEWEYAARGGLSGRRLPWGDTISHRQANYYSSSSYSYDTSPTRGYHPAWNDGVHPYTSPAGSFAANGYGLYDMPGNVWEWCNEWYLSSYYSFSPTNNPTGPAGPLTYRVIRGGGWSGIALYCRVANRSYTWPDFRHPNVGFRIVLDF